MADTKGSALGTISSVDRSTDLLYVIDSSGPTSNQATINTILGISGDPLGTSDSQSPTNKTFDNSNIFNVRDDRFTIQDSADTTKQAVFQASGITTATTRTYTLPNRDGTLVTLGGDQTFTGAITAPSAVLDQATITRPTLQTDSISEYTSAAGVTIDGLLIKDGLLPAGNIQPLNLVSGTGSSWELQDWVPTFTNLSGGTLNYAKYVQIGKIVYFEIKYTLAGANISGAVTFTTPTNIHGDHTNAGEPIPGVLSMVDTGSTNYLGVMLWASATTIQLYSQNSGVAYLAFANLSSTVPFTWANTDIIALSGYYEAA
jgi:hypothetical protein